ncbi:hypothetical protein QIU19_13900 [Capnocytophaga canimorsus]|nr:hypothetical protein [Capnocytophaga canimorsus]WGU68324.1 hypothetical protein QIU19_13900 [Capnocytophaga canimorsus]
MYSDINGGNFEVYLRKFIKSVKSTVVQDYLLFKLTEYLYRRSKPNGKNEELYLDLISDLKIRSQKLPKKTKRVNYKRFESVKRQSVKVYWFELK